MHKPNTSMVIPRKVSWPAVADPLLLLAPLKIPNSNITSSPAANRNQCVHALRDAMRSSRSTMGNSGIPGQTAAPDLLSQHRQGEALRTSPLLLPQSLLQLLCDFTPPQISMQDSTIRTD